MPIMSVIEPNPHLRLSATLWLAKGATWAGCGLMLAVRLQERHLYPRTNFQSEPCRCSFRVSLIIECIDLGCASNPMLDPSNFTAPVEEFANCTAIDQGITRRYLLKVIYVLKF